MTLILQIIADLISANPPDQRYLRSILPHTTNPLTIQELAEKISANPPDQRYLRSISSHHLQNPPCFINTGNLLKNQAKFAVFFAQGSGTWIGLNEVQHLAECRALEISRVGL